MRNNGSALKEWIELENKMGEREREMVLLGMEISRPQYECDVR